MDTQPMHSDQLLAIAGRLARFGGWSADLETGIVHFSDEVCAIHDVPPGTTITVEEGLDYYPPEWRPVLREAFTRCVEDGVPYDLELELLTRTGRKVWIRTVGEPVHGPDGDVVRVQGAFQDISGRKNEEARIERLESRLARLVEAMSDAFFTLDRDWRFTFLNEEAARILERPREELIGKPIWEEFPDAADGPFQERYHQALRENRSVQFEDCYTPLDRWFSVDAYPVEDGLAVHFHDITESRRTAEQLRRSQRLEAVGQLSGGVAHDFNNLLTIIQASAHTLLAELPADSSLHAVAAESLEAAEAGARLTKQLLAFSRRQVSEKRILDAGELLSALKPMLRRTIPESVDVALEIEDTELWIEADQDHLRHVVLNLVANAVDATEGRGRIALGVDRIELSAEEARRLPWEASEGTYTRITVEDDGTGMPPEVRERIFEPFFTTKPSGKGTGLGLPMVYGIVKESGGHVMVESKVGEGTTFRVLLPAAARPPAGSAPPPAPEAEPSSANRRACSATVLLVEDDDGVRSALFRMLERAGYDVVAAESGEEAMRLFEQHEGEIDLMVSDVVLGDIEGPALLDRLRTRRSDLPAILMSGYLSEELAEPARRAGAQFLQKPFSSADLEQAIRVAVGAAG